MLSEALARIGHERVESRRRFRAGRARLGDVVERVGPSFAETASSSLSRAARATAGLAPPVPAAKRELAAPHHSGGVEIA